MTPMIPFRRLMPVLTLALALCAPLPSTARAADPGNIGAGPRVGLSSNPDQVVVGVHYSAGQVAPHVRFQPNVEVGFGDDIKLLELNADFHYRFQDSWDVWNPYAGAGLGYGVAFLKHGDDQGDLQVHLIGGIEKGIKAGAFFTELKLGLGDRTADWKILAGWTFGRH